MLPPCRPHTRPHRVARNSTVAGAAAELVAALQLIMKLPRSECGPTNRYIHFVLRNRFELHESFHDALVSEGGGVLWFRTGREGCASRAVNARCLSNQEVKRGRMVGGAV